MNNVLLYVSGSISAFKACSLTSLLVKNGYNVKIVASKGALEFVGKASFEGISHNKLHTDMFNDEHLIPHIELAQKWADILVAYPCSADAINRMAQGLADDLWGAICLANNYAKPLLVAPAMNSQMFSHPSVQKSLKTLEEWGTIILPCGDGMMACGDKGYGRLLEPQDAFDYIVKELSK